MASKPAVKTAAKPVASETPVKKAAAKPAAKKTAPAAAVEKKPGTAVAVAKPQGKIVAMADIESIKAKLREQAAAMSERTAPPAGIKIQVTQDKKFKLPNGETVTELLACVVDFRTVHNFYEGEFDPKNIVPPVCFAVGTNPKAMVPVADSPELQAESCQVCPQNQFGSAVRGEGKACKNGRMLALLPPNEDGTDVDHEADIWLLGVSPTAIRAWDGFVQGLSRQHQLPPSAFLVPIGFNDAVTYAQLTFGEAVPIAALGEVLARQDEAAELLEQKPDWAGFEARKAEEATKAPARKPAGKAAAKGGMGARR